MNVQSLSGSWQFRQSGNLDWLPATVPGGVHTDLLANGLIPDPFSGDHEKRVQWVAQQDWEYRLRFQLDPGMKAMPQVWLVCDGLDTLAEIRLNGELLGRTDNMFRQYRWDVKALLSDQDNELLISFASPVQYCAAKQAIRPLAGVSQAIGVRSSRRWASGRLSASKAMARPELTRSTCVRRINPDRSAFQLWSASNNGRQAACAPA